ncbi:MBL fold metallo-hydrolase [Peribacillus aracenensis]|uniref:MBL fold metallo-hydrolase n=1 Tax=Peribacillus aracenensis TaxID=2976708 RepID=UPI0021A5F2AA|nr:MBL fold metallo-hydrolase [Peribacillus sp. BBB004]
MEKIGKTKEVAKGIYQIEIPTPFPVGPVNVYLLEGAYLTLVDTGPLTEEAWQTLNQGVRDIGYKVKDIRQVVLTHHHPDHCGLLERVRQVSGAFTYSHPLAIPYVKIDDSFMNFQAKFFNRLYYECGVPEESLIIINEFNDLSMSYTERSHIDECLKHDQALPHFPDWHVLFTPGHSQSQLSLYRADDRVMISGDHIIKHISSNALIEPPPNPSSKRPLSLIQYRTSLEMCANMEIDIIFSGHGAPVINHRDLILQRLLENWKRTDTIRGLLKESEKTVYELTTMLFPNVYQKELTLPISETLGHIDLLQILHQLEVKQRNEVLYYSL